MAAMHDNEFVCSKKRVYYAVPHSHANVSAWRYVHGVEEEYPAQDSSIMADAVLVLQCGFVNSFGSARTWGNNASNICDSRHGARADYIGGSVCGLDKLIATAVARLIKKSSGVVV